MSDISIIEFSIYAFVAYSSLLMLIISTIRDVPTTKALSTVRAIYMIPGIFAASVLSGSGVNITLNSIGRNSTMIAVNTTEVWTETVSEGWQVVMINPVWIYFNGMVAAILIVYVIFQILMLLTKTE